MRFTAVHLAAHHAAAALLLDAGAKVDAANLHENTPLITAAFSSRGRGDRMQLKHERG
jgi:ankyrin repeat protein